MNRSIWAQELGNAGAATPDAIGDVPSTADTVIIGAGYTGLNAARELARSGQQVVVLEKDSVGDGASGLNFGSAALGVASNFQDLCARYGADFARHVARLSRKVLTDLCELIDRECIACDLQKTKHITIALDSTQLEGLKTSKKGRDQFDPDHDWILLSKDMVSEYLDITAACGALMNPASYSLNPAKYLAGLHNSAVRAGAMVVERFGVSDIQRIGRELFECRFDSHTAAIRSKHVAVCTNGIRLPWFKPSETGLTPIKSHIIATAPLDAAQLARISSAVFSTAQTVPNYFRVTSGNRLLFGSRKNITAKESNARDAAELTARMNKLLLFTAGVPITHSWSGTLGLIFDGLPRIGVWDGIHYAFGYSGKGIPWSAHCGIAVANLINRKGHPEQAVSIPLHESVPVIAGHF